MINAFGRNYEELGSSDKGLILKNSGKVKIQWGKSYVDLLDNNGKLNVKVEKLIKSVQSEDDIDEDGFYYIEELGTLVAKVGENTLNVALTSGMTFISFMEEQSLESDEKYTALKNIGFIYSDIQDVDNYPTNGIIYNEKDQQLYIVKNGTILNKYQSSFPSSITNSLTISKSQNEQSGGALLIKGSGEENSIAFDYLKIYNEDFDSIIKINDNLIIRNDSGEIFRLSGHTLKVDNIESKGYKITNNGDKYVLEVDSIYSTGNVSYPKLIAPYNIGAKRNIILFINNFSIEQTEYFKLTFKYDNKFIAGDKLKFYFDFPLKSGKILVLPVKCTIVEVDSSQFSDPTEVQSTLTSIENENSALVSSFVYDEDFLQEYIQEVGFESESDSEDEISFDQNILNQKNLKCYLEETNSYSYNKSDYIRYQDYLTNSLNTSSDDNILVPMKLFKALEARVTTLENNT